MNQSSRIKATLMASIAMLIGSHTASVLADNGTGYQPPPPNYNQGPPPGYGYGGPGYGGPSFSGPWNNRGSGFSGPWNNRGSGFSGPWNNRGSGFSGPWNNRGSNWGPWGNRNNYGDFNNPFGHRSPGSWMNPSKGNMARNWDDMLNAPSRMGRMPGGWEAPSVSVPNPIDVGDDFSDAARDMPDQMDNFRYNN